MSFFLKCPIARVALALFASASVWAQATGDSSTLSQRTVIVDEIVITDAVDLPDCQAGPALRSLAPPALQAGNWGLVTQPGLSLKQYYPGGLATMSFRGTNAQQSAVRWQGVNISSPFLGLYDLSLLPEWSFNRLELVSSVQTVGGELSVSTNRGSLRPLVGLALEIGAFGDVATEVRIEGASRFKKNGMLWQRLAFRHSASDNDFPFTDERGRRQRLENAAFSRSDLLYELHLDPKSRGPSVELSFWQQTFERQLPFDRPDSRQRDENWRTTLSVHRNGRWQQRGQISYFAEEIDYNDQVSRLRSVVGQYAFERVFRVRRRLLEWRNRVENRFNSALAPAYGSRRQRNHFIAGQEIGIDLFSYTRLELDWQQELIDRRAAPFDLMIALEQHLGRAHRLRFEAAAKHRVPTLNDLFWQPGGNPDLQTERSRGVELTVERRSDRQAVRSRPHSWRYRLSGFAKRIDNFIQWTPQSGTGFWSPRNLKTVAIIGADGFAELEYRLGAAERTAISRFQVQAVRSVVAESIIADDASVGRQLAYVPPIELSWQQQVQYNDWTFFSNVFWQSHQFTTADNQQELSGFARWDAGIRRRLNLSETSTFLELRGLNLLDQTIQTYAGRFARGRHIEVSLNFEFR